jgi:hypothetical protein
VGADDAAGCGAGASPAAGPAVAAVVSVVVMVPLVPMMLAGVCSGLRWPTLAIVCQWWPALVNVGSRRPASQSPYT